MPKLSAKLTADYPSLQFEPGQKFCWSPKENTIMFKADKNDAVADWSLLHELSHALLEHRAYETDFELLLLEVAAWDKAKELALGYGVTIDEEHIQDCIDTYRDWLYQRSTCPKCSCTSLQQNTVTYKCFNCKASWTVTASRFCRPYRLTAKQQKTPSEAPKSLETTFL